MSSLGVVNAASFSFYSFITFIALHAIRVIRAARNSGLMTDKTLN